MLHDIRHAFRMFAASRGFVLTVLVTIGLGIGAGSAVFSVVDAVLLRPLPYPQSERLVSIWASDLKTGRPYVELSPPEFRALRDGARSLAGVAAYSLARRDFADLDGRSTRVTAARVTNGFLSVLGASVTIGRGFSAEEYKRQQAVVILSHRLWTARYAAQHDILGKRIYIRQEPHEVIGVLARDQEFPRGADILRPIRDSEIEDEDREFLVVARLRPGVSAAVATDEAAALVQNVPDRDASSPHRFSAWVQPLQSMLVKDARMALLLLLAAVAVVVLMVCVNVAGLLLARAAARRKEMAVRAALGASRRRLASLCLAESLVLAGTGGLLGVGLGHLLLRAMIAIVPREVPRLNEVVLDARATAIMVGVALACGVLFGVAPAWTESRQDPRDGFDGSRSPTASPRRLWLRRALVTAQIMMSTVLIVAAAQIAAGFQHLVEFDRGFRHMDLLEMQVAPTRPESSDSIAALYDGVRRRVAALPAVRTVEFANFSAMDTRSLRRPIRIEGAESTRSPVEVNIGIVSPGYFQAIGARRLDGRLFAWEIDYKGAAPVAIVNQAFVDALLRDGPVLGRTLTIQDLSGQKPRIVGVVADLKPSVQSVPAPTIYVPFGQQFWPAMHVTIGMASDDPVEAVPMIREQIWAAAPGVTLENVGTLRDKVARTLVTPRFNTAAVASFAMLALVLAAIGIYGLVALVVSSRRHEMAIRQAVGASPANIVGIVLRDGLMLAVAGMAAGLPAALAAARLLSSSLYGVVWWEPSTLLVAVMVTAGATLLASLFPAIRAVRADPVMVLRE